MGTKHLAERLERIAKQVEAPEIHFVWVDEDQSAQAVREQFVANNPMCAGHRVITVEWRDGEQN